MSDRKSNKQLVQEFQSAVYNVCTASLGDSLLKANQQLPIAYKALMDRFKEYESKLPK